MREIARSAAWYESLRPVFRRGHELQLLRGGDELFPAMEAAIAAAEREVRVETYLFEDDPSGVRIAQALAAAAERGVDVKLVVDGFGVPSLAGEVGRVLSASRVKIQVFRPERRWFALERQRIRRLHRKLATIDGRVAFVGGINIVDDRHDPNHGPLERPRLDFAVQVRGPLVATAVHAMQRLWWELALRHRPLQTLARGANGDRDPTEGALGSRRDRHDDAHLGPEGALSTPHERTSVNARSGIIAALVLRDNFRYRRTIEAHYLHAIRHARREVLIACAYFFPGVRFRRALLAAAARGVRVRLLLQGRVEYRLQHYASQALYDDLLRGGIEIIEYVPSFLHAKVAVIDDWATVGSSNIDPFSLLLAREANVVVRDTGFAAQLRGCIEQAIDEGGRPVAVTRHARRPWYVRVMNALAFLALRVGVMLVDPAGRYDGRGRGGPPMP